MRSNYSRRAYMSIIFNRNISYISMYQIANDLLTSSYPLHSNQDEATPTNLQRQKPFQHSPSRSL